MLFWNWNKTFSLLYIYTHPPVIPTFGLPEKTFHRVFKSRTPYKDNSLKNFHLMLKVLLSEKNNVHFGLRVILKSSPFSTRESFLVKQPSVYRSLLCELLTTLKNNGQKLLLLETWGAAKSKRKTAAAAAADVHTYACINQYQASLLLAACINHPRPRGLQFTLGTV